jgi:hypothetical protein
MEQLVALLHMQGEPLAWDSCCKVEGNSCPCKRFGVRRADEKTVECTDGCEKHVLPNIGKVCAV